MAYSDWSGLASSVASLASAVLTDTTASTEASVVADNSAAAYSSAYTNALAVATALEEVHSGEEDITAARMEGVAERTAIGMAQAEAESLIVMNAAVNGTTGDSVADAVTQTESNAAFRLADQQIAEESAINDIQSDIYTASTESYYTEDDYTVDYVESGTLGSSYSLAGSILTGVSSSVSSVATLLDES